jgi:hypothetical protein
MQHVQQTQPAAHAHLHDEYGRLPDDWQTLTQIALNALKHSNGLVEQAHMQSERLFQEYLAHGCIKQRLLREALNWEDLAGILFYNKLYTHLYHNGRRPPSPVAQKPDPSWMIHTDFCFFNVRATAKLPHETGNFLDATRLLALLRVHAIHLAPFFESVFGVVYAQDSFTIINDEVTNPYYEAQGFSRYQQLRYFIDCCHLLGKAVGFDLTAHTSGFSKLCFDRPDLFRWVRFTSDYTGFYEAQSIDEQYQEPVQAAFVAHIRELTHMVCAEYRVERLESTAAPLSAIRAAFRHVKNVVRSFGYYPVVPHTWSGVGLPGIASYHQEGHYPIWDYRDIHGADQSSHAIGIHASLKYHTNLVANRAPYFEDAGWSAGSWEPTIEYLSNLFPTMHHTYGFDFLRIDYVDHIFNNTIMEQGREIVLGEQLSPSQLKRIADTARACFPACGMLADHLGNDIDRYRQAGFTVTLGREVQHPLNRQNVSDMFSFNDQLQQFQGADPGFGSVVFPIDTHDMGHPALLGRDLPDREGRATISLRHLFARFATAWRGQRPKYETLGNQDLSAGIYRVNNRPESLYWGSDRAHLTAYHLIEDAYEQCRSVLRAGVVTARYIQDDYCWWRIDTQSGDVSLVILTWIGEHYDYQRAGEYAMHTIVSLPRPVGTGVTVTPLLGMQAAARPEDSDRVSVRYDAIQCLSQDERLHITWPHLTSWVLRVDYRR